MSDKRLTIALDYDDTFTAHVQLFSRFIVDATLANVNLVCIEELSNPPPQEAQVATACPSGRDGVEVAT